MIDGTTPILNPSASHSLDVRVTAAVAAERRGEQRAAWPIAKSVCDRLASIVLLVAIAPILLFIAVLIKLDSPGPVLFRQVRVGRHGELFTVLKLRTMQDKASSELHRRYIASLATGASGTGTVLKKLVDDPRVTRVGAFLRRSSLDELPQLFNVLRGEMSIVGPRPALAYELDFYEPQHFQRFDVRPGLTGLWQVSGRSQLGFLSMLSLDSEYARTTSPRVDAMILLRTPLTLLRKHAA